MNLFSFSFWLTIRIDHKNKNENESVFVFVLEAVIRIGLSECIRAPYTKPKPPKAISWALSPKMNSPAHQTCIFIVDFGVENGNFSEIGLFWKSVACCRNMMLMLKKIVNVMDAPANEVR